MAKQKGDIGLSLNPDFPPSGELKDFILITDENRKKAIVIGRICYTFEKQGDKNELLGYFVISPCLEKGWHNIPHYPFNYKHHYINGVTHYKTFIDEDMDRIEWVRSNKEIIDKGIKNKNLYIKLTDPILKFTK